MATSNKAHLPVTQPRTDTTPKKALAKVISFTPLNPPQTEEDAQREADIAAAQYHAPSTTDKRIPVCGTKDRFYMVGPALKSEDLNRRATEAGRTACQSCLFILGGSK